MCVVTVSVKRNGNFFCFEVKEILWSRYACHRMTGGGGDNEWRMTRGEDEWRMMGKKCLL